MNVLSNVLKCLWLFTLYVQNVFRIMFCITTCWNFYLVADLGQWVISQIAVLSGLTLTVRIVNTEERKEGISPSHCEITLYSRI
jgi:hypothetical protein